MSTFCLCFWSAVTQVVQNIMDFQCSCFSQKLCHERVLRWLRCRVSCQSVIVMLSVLFGVPDLCSAWLFVLSWGGCLVYKTPARMWYYFFARTYRQRGICAPDTAKQMVSSFLQGLNVDARTYRHWQYQSPGWDDPVGQSTLLNWIHSSADGTSLSRSESHNSSHLLSSLLLWNQCSSHATSHCSDR